MNNKAIILHGWMNNKSDQWYPWLKNELINKSYEVILNDIPTFDSNFPKLKNSLSFIRKNNIIDKDTVIIGHSLGCVLGLRVAEKNKFKKLILVAGWDFNDLYPNHRLFWPNAISHEAIIKNVKEIICFSSDNDPYITAFQSEEMSKRLKGKFILLKNAGHFTKDFGITKIPELMNYL